MDIKPPYMHLKVISRKGLDGFAISNQNVREDGSLGSVVKAYPENVDKLYYDFISMIGEKSNLRLKLSLEKDAPYWRKATLQKIVRKHNNRFD